MASDAVLQLMKDNQVPDVVRDYLVQTLGLVTLARVHNALLCLTCMSCGAVCAHLYMCGTPFVRMPSARCAFRPPDLFARVWRSCPVPSTYDIVLPSLSCQSQYLRFIITCHYLAPLLPYLMRSTLAWL